MTNYNKLKPFNLLLLLIYTKTLWVLLRNVCNKRTMQIFHVVSNVYLWFCFRTNFVFCNVHLVVLLFEIKTHLLDVGSVWAVLSMVRVVTSLFTLTPWVWCARFYLCPSRSVADGSDTVPTKLTSFLSVIDTYYTRSPSLSALVRLITVSITTVHVPSSGETFKYM